MSRSGQSAHGAHRAARTRHRAGSAIARLTLRLLRRGAVVLVVALAAYAVIEVRAFESLYPDEASRVLVAQLGQDPAMRILAGRPAGTSIGALAVWDGGWMLQMVAGVWAVVTTARLLRGDEEAQRSELALVGPLRARSALGAQLVVLLAVSAVVGLAVGTAMVAAGAEVLGSVLFGAEVIGFTATFVALTAVLSQLLGSRGQALGFAATVLGGAVLLRMVANSADSRSWVAWLSPLGWNDRLEPYGGNHWPVLLVPVAVCGALLAVAVALRDGRDSGAGIVAARATERSRDVWLSSPLAFAWRATAGTLLGWAAGLAALGAVAGAMLPSVEEFIAGDPSYGELLAAFGLDVTDVSLGFVAMMGTVTGLAMALYVTWRVGAARTEEDSTRLEHLLVRPVSRLGWLGGHVLLAVVSVLLLAGTTVSSTWAAAALVNADLDYVDAAAAVLNALPVAALFLGLGIFFMGVAPRLVVPVGASLAMGSYILNTVGPALHWPDAVVDLSPFHHLEMVPVDPFGTTAAVVMVGLAAVLVAAGMLAFQRRDLVGG